MSANHLTDGKTYLEIAIDAQHGGFPSRLLDVTYNCIVALYFAIMKVHPTPFCVMDEIEAALDEANVVRYARYMRRIAGKTQFIVITHRRGTMEEADVLYGVTMQEKGVSRILTINLNDMAKELHIK